MINDCRLQLQSAEQQIADIDMQLGTSQASPGTFQKCLACRHCTGCLQVEVDLTSQNIYQGIMQFQGHPCQDVVTAGQ